MRRPKVKAAHRPVRRPGGAIWIGGFHHGLGSEIQDGTGLVWPLLQGMTGEVEAGELAASVAHRHGVTRAEAMQVMDFLVESGWVEDAAAEPPANLTARDLERYDRGIQLQSWVDLTPRRSRFELQSRLKSSRVTVLGLGGIGSAVAASLAASGIGRLHCVDGDVVELSNLNRQMLYSEADLGRSKVDAALDRLRALNSDIEITGADLMLTGPADMLAQVRGSDIFVLCADRPRGIEFWADEVSHESRMPWAVGSYGGPRVVIGAFLPGRSACYACSMAGDRRRVTDEGRADLLDLPPIAGPSAVNAATAQIAGQLVVLEVLSFLHGWPVQTAGGMFFLSLTEFGHHRFLKSEPAKDCRACAGLEA